MTEGVCTARLSQDSAVPVPSYGQKLTVLSALRDCVGVFLFDRHQ